MIDLLSVLLAIGLVNLMAWLTPGPNMLVIANAALNNGRGAGVLTAFGVSLGGLCWMVFTIFGATTLFTVFPNALLLLRLLGAGYLIWLGIKTFESRNTPTFIDRAEKSGNSRDFRRGFLVIITNPKAAIYFGSIFAALVPVDASVRVLVIIIAANFAQALFQNLITVMVFSKPAVVRQFQATGRRVASIFGALYCVLGIGVIVDTLRRSAN